MVASTTCFTRRKNGGGSNANESGGRTIHQRGYVMVWAPNYPPAARSKFVFEHILVTEESIGRCLMGGETVYRRNRVRSEKSISNLELWKRPQPTGIWVDDAVKWARRIIEVYDNHEIISSPTTTEASLGNPWRCWESNPGPSIP
jgi:hypothetical protein